MATPVTHFPVADDSIMASPKSISFLIQGKQFAAELWGEKGQIPVIALHGWLDNCHSFRPLAPYLKNCQILAIDMAGHGHTEHRSADASYHIWDDVREVLMIANEMGWQKFTLLGHSRGAIIATLIAAVAPESVRSMILIEGFWPETMLQQDAPAQLAKFVHRYLASDGISKGYKAIDPMIEGRCRAGFGIGKEAACLLVERNIEQVDGYFYWRTDSRLMMPSPMMLTVEEAESFLSAIQCPALLFIASDGLGKNIAFLQPKIKMGARVHFIILDGGHHLHMEGAVRKIVDETMRFLTLDRGE